MTNRTKTSGSKLIQIAAHIGALLPLAWLLWDFFTDNLSANPIQDVTLRTGKTALVLLILSLAATPVNTVFKFRQAIRLRKPLGLYAFLYVSLHLLIFVALDYGLNLALIYEAIFEKRYALVGFSAFLILLPLAVTSTKGWQKRLKKNWKRLHKLVYLAAVLAIVHYVWLVKSNYGQPIIWGGVLAVLLALRIPAVRRVARRK